MTRFTEKVCYLTNVFRRLYITLKELLFLK